MQYLKADTSVKVVIGPVVAVGDGFTPVTTLSLSTADEAEIMKHDAAAVTSISGNTFAAITAMDGYYNLTITAAQLDTEGMLTVGINDDSLCLPVRHDFMVVNANVYDSLFAAATTDYLQVDAIQFAGTAYATALAAEVDAVWDEAAADHITAGTIGEATTLGSAALADTTITGTPTSTTFTLSAGSAVDNFYNDQLVYILSGTGIGQVRTVSSYNGTTRLVTVDEAFATTPAATDRVAIIIGHVHPVSQIRDSILTTQMTESYAADGSAPTLAQALMMIQQMLGDFSISGTTMTVRKVDGATAAATFTLDDGTSPTGLTRAT